MSIAPSYLAGYQELYRESPRRAASRWFAEARYGLFLHYGLYSLLERHEWVQCREKIPVAEYAKLAEKFSAAKFDAEFIASFAADCGMKYVNITTRHHDSFCLFESRATDFHSVNTPCGRDLVGELAAACDRHGLGFCLYYSHGRDWRHPHAPNNDEWGGSARPEYDPPEPSYAYGEEHDLDQYLEFMSQQIAELLDNYGPIAAIWLDGIMTPFSGDFAKFRCQELYDLIHARQPQVLLSYKQGLLGTEDFFAPEHKPTPRFDGKPVEVCTTMCPGSWGYFGEKAGQHRSADDVWAALEDARAKNYNLLLNTGPLPDGSIDQEDEEILRQVGQRLRCEGLA